MGTEPDWVGSWKDRSPDLRDGEQMPLECLVEKEQHMCMLMAKVQEEEEVGDAVKREKCCGRGLERDEV